MRILLILLATITLGGCSNLNSETPNVDATPELPSINLESKPDTAPSTPAPNLDTEVKIETQTLQIGEQSFDVEIADTATERQRGLMYRESMPLNRGMLFVFEGEAPRNFWMKNTLIPLDMVWIDASKTIVDIQAAQPCEVADCPQHLGAAPAQYVLELNQGVLEAPVGETAEF